MTGSFKHPSIELYLEGELSSIFERIDEYYDRDDWDYREDLDRQLASAPATRYVATCRCDE